MHPPSAGCGKITDTKLCCQCNMFALKRILNLKCPSISSILTKITFCLYSSPCFSISLFIKVAYYVGEIF